MITLSSCEILDELKKLGIKTSSAEMIQYVIEYAAYYSHQDQSAGDR